MDINNIFNRNEGLFNASTKIEFSQQKDDTEWVTMKERTLILC